MNTEYTALDREFVERLYNHRQFCINMLLRRGRGDSAMASDVFLEAIITMQQKNRNGQISPETNLKAYLISTCFHISRRQYYKAQEQLIKGQELRRYFAYYLEESQLPAENSGESEEQFLQALEWSLTQLGNKCRQLIRYFYYMIEIANLMGFKSQSVATATKYRCFKTLQKYAVNKKEELEKEYTTIKL